MRYSVERLPFEKPRHATKQMKMSDNMAFNAFVVSLIFINTCLCFPLSTSEPNTVTCFATDLAAPTTDLYKAVYDFCTNDFPTDRIFEETKITRSIGLEAGATAVIEVDLDPVVPDWMPGECLYNLGKAIKECEMTHLHSTGGEYSPHGTGSSRFNVKVTTPSVLARSAPASTAPASNESITSTHASAFNATASIHTDFSSACISHPWDPSPISVDAATARWIALLVCARWDGHALTANQPLSEYSSGSSGFYAKATSTVDVKLYQDDCKWAFDTLFKACVWDDQFYGGVEDVAPVQLTLQGFPTLLNTGGVAKDTDAVDAEVTASSLDSREIDQHDLAALRASADCYDSNAALDVYTAYGKALDFCQKVGTVTWTGGQGSSHLYTDVSPWLSARAQALEDVSIAPADCSTALQFLINACTTDSQYRGGSVEYQDVRWAAVAVPDSMTDQDATSSLQNSSCMRAEASPVDKQVAGKAISEFCQQYTGHTIPANESVAGTVSVDGISIGMRIAAGDDDYMVYPQWCYANFEALLRDCSDGFDDPGTKGGTLAGEVSYTLSVIVG